MKANGTTITGQSSAYSYGGFYGTQVQFNGGTTGFDFCMGLPATDANYISQLRTSCKISQLAINGTNRLLNGIRLAAANLIEELDVIGCIRAGILLDEFTNQVQINKCCGFDNYIGLYVTGSETTPWSCKQSNWGKNNIGVRIEGGVLVQMENCVIESNNSYGLEIHAPANTVSPSSMAWSSINGGEVAVVLPAPHSFAVGDAINISGATNTGTGGDAFVDGTFQVHTVKDGQNFTYLLPAGPGVVGTIGGTIVITFVILLHHLSFKSVWFENNCQKSNDRYQLYINSDAIGTDINSHIRFEQCYFSANQNTESCINVQRAQFTFDECYFTCLDPDRDITLGTAAVDTLFKNCTGLPADIATKGTNTVVINVG